MTAVSNTKNKDRHLFDESKKNKPASSKKDPGKTLVIVESPSKAKTLKKLLGKGYDIQSSVGHIRDLPKSRLAIDIENDFTPEYILIRGKGKTAAELKKRAAQSDRVLLASDPDREGEAIAWHLADVLGLDPKAPCRVRMYEITPQGVEEAFREVTGVDMAKVDAQQARRVLDRLVGYKLSPLLWRKIKRGLSAGRVQSAALRIICDREEEIESFVPQEYWNLTVSAGTTDGRAYSFRVDKREGKSLIKDGKTLLISSEEEALKIEREIRSNPLEIVDFVAKDGKRKPPPPFKTSSLQQEAARRLNFAPRRTMSLAQSLYEGVSVPGRVTIGLITYMRTDSLRLSQAAVQKARQLIRSRYGERYVPEKPQVFEGKSRSQDAHEAIRPTDVSITPEDVKEYLDRDQFRLYELIWKRFVACQMAPAVIARTTVEARAGSIGMRQSGATVRFEGWGAVWPLDMKEEALAEAEKGERLQVKEIRKEQMFTRPPARYNEAGLIKVLEDEGIGRPSTYAAIVQTLYDRRYVIKDEEKRIKPTALGRTVDGFLKEHFPHIVDVAFTAGMEENLDEVESSRRRWVEVVREFWDDFFSTLSEADEKAKRVPPPPPEPIGEDCPQCGRPLVKRWGRFGEFIGCSGYSDKENKCTYTRPVVDTLGVKCPKCKEGEVVRRKGKKGRPFYGCSRYPDCDFVSWQQPTGEECPDCGGVVVIKGRKKEHVCSLCGWKKAKKKEDADE
jgi:DNA topoisomerase-1